MIHYMMRTALSPTTSTIQYVIPHTGNIQYILMYIIPRQVIARILCTIYAHNSSMTNAICRVFWSTINRTRGYILWSSSRYVPFNGKNIPFAHIDHAIRIGNMFVTNGSNIIYSKTFC